MIKESKRDKEIRLIKQLLTTTYLEYRGDNLAYIKLVNEVSRLLPKDFDWVEFNDSINSL